MRRRKSMSKKVIADPTPEEWVSALDDGFVTDHAMEHPSRRFKTQRKKAHDRIALEHEQFCVHEAD
jgi:hypothetical protein